MCELENNPCIFFMTHYVTPEVIDRRYHLEAASGCKVYLCVDTEKADRHSWVGLNGVLTYNMSLLKSEMQLRDSLITNQQGICDIVPGNQDVVMLYLYGCYQQYLKNYTHFWKVDNDVFFCGDGFKDLFHKSPRTDLYYVRGSKKTGSESGFKHDPDYYWFKNCCDVNLPEYKIFGAYFRLSAFALRYLYGYYKLYKPCAHFEVAIPSILKQYNQDTINRITHEMIFEEAIGSYFCDYSYMWEEKQIPKDITYEYGKIYHPVKICP